jgi:O-methyltransferase
MKLRRLRGKFKGFFFIARLHALVPSHIFIFFGQMARLSRWVHKNKKLAYTDFYANKFDYNKRYGLYEHVIQTEQLDTAIDYLEFGVSRGTSFKWWTERLRNPAARFYGFDTFSGLPEDWGPFKKGDMANNNEPPQIDGNRHTFYQGLFQQTLLPFLAGYKANTRRVIHMDADLYTATLYVLTLLTPYLKKGDIIFFDEFNVPMHEFKAFMEWTKSFYIRYEVLGSVNNFYQTAFRLE